MFVEHVRKIEERLEQAPVELQGDKFQTSATDIACAIGVLLITGAFIAWMIFDMVKG
jgi:hypothetical protein